MLYTYKLEESDYHTHLLYTISTSSSAIKTRAKIRLMMTLFLLIFAFMSYANESTIQTVYFLSLAILAFLFMPKYTRWSYSKTYLKHVRKFYKDRMSEPTSFYINERSFQISDSQGESTIDFSEIDTVNELDKYCFIKLKSGQSIIIPLYKINESETLKTDLKNIAKIHDIPWNDETDWIWK